MKSKTLARWRASIAGATLAVATLVGAIGPAIEAHAATAVTNVTAVFNGSTNKVDVSWTATGHASETYRVATSWPSGDVRTAVNASGNRLENLTSTSASFDKYWVGGVVMGSGVDLVAGDQFTVLVFTYDSSDSSTNSVSAGTVTFGGAGSGSAFATTPLTLSVNPGTNFVEVTWNAPSQSGSEPITGYAVTASASDGTGSQTFTYAAGNIDLFPVYPFVANGNYRVRVAAINGVAGTSPNHAEATFQMPAAPSGEPGGASLANLPSGISAISISGASNAKTIGFVQTAGSTSAPVAQGVFDLSQGNVDGSDFTFGSDAAVHKAFAHNVARKTVDGTFTLYVPFKEGDAAVGICPGADSLAAVSATCANFYFLKEGETKNGATASIETAADGAKYWKVSGLTGTGGFSTTLAAAEAAAAAAGVPDTGFSLGLANPALVIGVGAISATFLFLIGRKLARR